MSAAESRRRSPLALYAVLVVLAVLYILPFLINISSSFKTEADAASDPISLIPSPATTEAYRRLFLRSDSRCGSSTRPS